MTLEEVEAILGQPGDDCDHLEFDVPGRGYSFPGKRWIAAHCVIELAILHDQSILGATEQALAHGGTCKLNDGTVIELVPHPGTLRERIRSWFGLKTARE